jgi:hypothetical protein
MKETHILTAFAVLVGVAFVLLWRHVSKSSLQVGGALYGIPGADPITPLMAATVIVWFILVGTIVYMRRPRK